MSKFKNYETLSHAWAHQTCEEGVTYNGNMFFDNKIIYSYGNHFPIACHYADDVVLLTTDSYSNTTAKHIGHVQSSIPFSLYTYYVPRVVIPNKKRSPEDWENAHVENLSHYIQEVLTSDDKRKRARAGHVIDSYEARAFRAKEAFPKYIAAFNLKKTAKKFKELHDIMNIPIEGTSDKLAPEMDVLVERVEKRARAAFKKANKKAILETKQELTRWISGDKNYVNAKYLDSVYLRIRGNDVETTSSASVPLKHAQIMYKRLVAGKEIVGHSIGHYKIDKANDKIITIGCHHIPMSEVIRILN